MRTNPFDRACRYLAKSEPVTFLAWLLELPPEHFRFRGWIDARFDHLSGYAK
jgi:hypothetical protein